MAGQAKRNKACMADANQNEKQKQNENERPVFFAVTK